MSLTPFVLVDTPLGGLTVGAGVELSREEQHHLRTVLRLRPGARVELADGSGGRADGVLVGDRVELVTAAVTATAPRPQLVLLQALAKGRRFDEVVRQTTELGVDRIVPVAAERSIADLREDRAERAVARWRSVARAACEQARRPQVPQVDAPCTLAAALATCAELPAVVVAAVPGAMALPAALASTLAGDPPVAVAVAIGPEGGWTERESAAFAGAGVTPVGLGPTVLRTEHAGAAALAVLAASFARW